MKKIFCYVALIFVFCCILVSCENEKIPEHSHTFGEWTTVANASCLNDGLKERICDCGEKETENVPATGHSYIEGVCEGCGDISSEPTADEYFIFTELEDGTYSVAAKDVTNMPKVVVIPAEYNGKAVTRVADYAFIEFPTEENPSGVYCLSVEHISIPDSVTSIGEGAFCGMFLLESIKIPNSVNEIGDYALYGLTSLKELTIPDKLTSIGYYVFNGCASLKEINIPNSVTSIGKGAFGNLFSCQKINIPNSVTHIGAEAFYSCISLTSITIPESVTTLDESALDSCFSLYEIINYSSIAIKINNDIVQIHNGDSGSKVVVQDDYVFCNVDGINYLINYLGDDENIVFPNDYNGEEYKINNAFFSFSMSQAHEAVKQLTNGKLDRCPGVPYYKSVMLPDFITVIDYSIFGECDTLETVKIRETSKLQKIEDNAFKDCPQFAFNEDEWSYYLGNDENPYIYLHKVKSDNITSFVGENGTVVIATYAFANCDNLSSVSLPDTLKEIKEGAFLGCETLSSILIPDSVTIIGDYAFMDCTNLSSIIMSNNIFSIGVDAFRFKEYDISPTIQYNEYDGCKYLGSDTNPYLVLMSAKENVSSHIEMRDDTRLIYNRAFKTNYNLESIVIGDSVIGIGNEAFALLGIISQSDIHPLKSITISNSVVYIGELAFYNCNSLMNITIPDSITSIGAGAFSQCTSINNVILPNSISSIADATFYNCRSLTDITIPNSVTSMGARAFEGCGFTSFVMPDSVTSIDPWTFRGCKSLTSVVISDSVRSIGTWAFLDCNSLSDVYYTGAEEEWADIAIYSYNEHLTNANIHYNYVPEE